MAAKVQACNLYSSFQTKQKRPPRDKHSKCPWVLSNLFTNECQLHRERTDRKSLQTTKPKNFSKWRANQKKKSLSLNQFINEAHIYTSSTALSRGSFQDPSSCWNSQGLQLQGWLASKEYTFLTGSPKPASRVWSLRSVPCSHSERKPADSN